MSIPASPRLQTEFLHFLEQKLLNVETQLRASEQERNELQIALAQSESKHEASSKALEELRSNASEVRILFNVRTNVSTMFIPLDRQPELIGSLRSELTHVYGLLSAEREHGTEMKRVLREMEAKTGTLANELDQSKIEFEQLKRQEREERLRQAAKVKQSETSVHEKDEQIMELRNKLATIETAHKKALVAHEGAIATENQLQRQLRDVSAELKTTKATLASSTASKPDTTRYKRDYGKSKVLASGDGVSPEQVTKFKDKMLALPGPGETIDFSNLVPIELPLAERWKRIEELRKKQIVKHRDLTSSGCLMWLPDSQHALLVFPIYRYRSTARMGAKWSRCETTGFAKGTYELFHDYQKKCYYVGTYQALEGPGDICVTEICVTSFVRSVANLHKAVAEQTEISAPDNNAVAITLPEMYRMGILKTQLCIGFNHRLDAELHRKGPPFDEALPDSVLETDGPIQKRKRPSQSSGSDSEGSTEETEEPACKEAKISE
ncbi:uncharacterized protein B0H18DRAFT_1124573 [Fomitopsis serialis]|uniref:uncharacterized protein n=1 Tax=Fomitopsis serialis TaxID=139415 RepID=UPI002008026F|nr:uncharacterized protein B0H18DRAFT_1124573 [Neoantrodia serialis]KAH9915893.1 hypothetical protein B0H18DRAFT_1124573 [Neoantrodia serialis]